MNRKLGTEDRDRRSDVAGVSARARPVLRIWKAGNLLGPSVIVFAAFVAILPQLIRGNSCGHDFDVHLVSWFDCLNALRHGILYPHWAPSPNYGAGEPRFVYYPPLTWMLGAALGAVLPWNLVPIALTLLILAATGLATRALAREALEDLPATLAGCVAIFSGFTLFNAYERCAFPEFTGGFWLPIIILFVLRDRFPAASLFRRVFDGSIVPIAIALAGAWFSNLPLGIIAGYLLLGVALLWAILDKSWVPLLRAAIAAPLGLGLAAIYWAPAASERDWVDIRQATDDPGYDFENNWLFSHHANPVLALHDVVLRQVSWIAIFMIAVALIAVLICFLRGSLPGPGKNRWWVPLAAIPVVVLYLLFPISRPVWHSLPQMPFLQYPWRMLEAVEAPMSIFFVAAIWPTRPDARIVRGAILAVCAALFLAATAYAGTAFFQVCYPEDTVASMLAAYRAGAGFEGMFEYAPPDADITTIATGLPDACLVSDPEATLGKPDPDDPGANPSWAPDQDSCLATFAWDGSAQVNPEHRTLYATMPRPGFLILRLESSPSWIIRVLGRRTLWLGRPDGLMAIPVPRGPVIATFDWEPGPGAGTGRWLTVLSALLLLTLSLYELRLACSRLT